MKLSFSSFIVGIVATTARYPTVVAKTSTLSVVQLPTTLLREQTHSATERRLPDDEEPSSDPASGVSSKTSSGTSIPSKGSATISRGKGSALNSEPSGSLSKGAGSVKGSGKKSKSSTSPTPAASFKSSKKSIPDKGSGPESIKSPKKTSVKSSTKTSVKGSDKKSSKSEAEVSPSPTPAGSLPGKGSEPGSSVKSPKKTSVKSSTKTSVKGSSEKTKSSKNEAEGSPSPTPAGSTPSKGSGPGSVKSSKKKYVKGSGKKSKSETSPSGSVKSSKKKSDKGSGEKSKTSKSSKSDTSTSGGLKISSAKSKSKSSGSAGTTSKPSFTNSSSYSDGESSYVPSRFRDQDPSQQQDHFGDPKDVDSKSTASSVDDIENSTNNSSNLIVGGIVGMAAASALIMVGAVTLVGKQCRARKLAKTCITDSGAPNGSDTGSIAMPYDVSLATNTSSSMGAIPSSSSQFPSLLNTKLDP